MIAGNMWHRLRLFASVVIVLAVLTLLFRLDGEGLVYRYFGAKPALTAMLACAVLYILVLAIPFVPGMELGWLLMGAFGIPGIFAAWFGTVLGLALGFTLARYSRSFRFLQNLVIRWHAFEAADPGQLSPVTRLLQRCLHWQQQHPYLFLIAALNLPGNLVIGGGGGIAWISGLTSTVDFHRYLPVTALATSAVPLLLLAGLLR